jgi:hypothetical protein
MLLILIIGGLVTFITFRIRQKENGDKESVPKEGAEESKKTGDQKQLPPSAQHPPSNINLLRPGPNIQRGETRAQLPPPTISNWKAGPNIQGGVVKDQNTPKQ